MRNNYHILLTEGGSRQVLPIAKAFKKIGYTVTSLNSSKLDLGNVSKYIDYRITINQKTLNYNSTKTIIEKILKSNKYDLVLPLADFTARILSNNKEEFSKYCKVAVNDLEVFQKTSDKLTTMLICTDNSIPCPQTVLNFTDIKEVMNLTFPVVLKPRSGWGSIGFNIVENQATLNEIIKNDNIKLDEYLIQEYIPNNGRQYNAHMFIDSNREVKTAMVTEKVRWFPTDGGASTLSVTDYRPDIVKICTQLLSEIGWQGYCDIDLIEDPRDGIPKVIEINPRISANVKICFDANINIAEQIIKHYFDKDVPSYLNYEKNIRLRCLHTDILWFIKSKDRFKSKPSWFNFNNTYDQIFTWSDPLPWFSFTIQSLMKYRKEMKRRKRKIV